MSHSFTYAGIGSRETPLEIQEQMRRIASALEEAGFHLYSGGAPGADHAFERGVRDPSHFTSFLPEKGFFKRTGSSYRVIKDENLMLWMKAKNLAADLHPLGRRMDADTWSLMARNCFQVLGPQLKNPVDFVVCWTPKYSLNEEGRVIEVSGGTGQAVRLAVQKGIEVFHLALPDAELHLDRKVQSLLATRAMSASPSPYKP